MKTKKWRKKSTPALGKDTGQKRRTKTPNRLGPFACGNWSGETDPQQTKLVTAEDIRTIAEPLCEAEGMELIHVEFQRETGGRVLRLYIDKPGGVMLDDCVHVSRQVGDILAVDLGDIGPYHLEVTSPGPDRPLGKARDFERFRGDKVKIRFRLPQADQEGQKWNDAPPAEKTVQGILQGMSEGSVRLLVHDRTVSIPVQEITRARILPEK